MLLLPSGVVGTSPTVLSGAPRSARERAQRRAVVIIVFVQLIHINTRPTVPWGRSLGLLPAVRDVTEILVLSVRTRVGKGLSIKITRISFGVIGGQK